MFAPIVVGEAAGPDSAHPAVGRVSTHADQSSRRSSSIYFSIASRSSFSNRLSYCDFQRHLVVMVIQYPYGADVLPAEVERCFSAVVPADVAEAFTITKAMATDVCAAV